MEWELSKENVLPRKNGRTVSQLVSALQPKEDHTSEIRATKQQFEEELRTYQGDDHLDIWFRYITWMEETNPQGGKDLASLLKSCLLTFSEVDKYKNDPRYVEIWVKFANLYDNPILLYEHMFAKGIGSQNAMFYEAWASAYELLGNSKKADAIYTEGLRMKAEPFNYLQRRHYEFQNRTFIEMMKKASLTDKESVNAMEAEGRAAFISLKTNGKKVSAIRPHGPQPTRTDVRVPLLAKSNQQQQPKFEIHTDENTLSSDVVLPQCDEYESIPFKTKVNWENCKNPGPWPQNKIIPKKSFAVHRTAPFDVQNDDMDYLATPNHIPEMDSKALSVQKDKKEAITPMDVINPVPSGIKQVPMYCKEKVYAGVEEFSFEEIRALRWKRRHEEKMYHALVEKNKKLKEEQEQILLKNEKLLMQHQVLMQKSLEENVVEMKPVEPQEHSFKNVSSRDLTMNGSLNRSGQCVISSVKTPETSQNTSQTSQTGFNSSFQNKDGKKAIYAPSPTPNSMTMETLEVVRGFYCDSINLGKDTTMDKDQDADNFAVESEQVYQEPVPTTAPFVICEDEQEFKPPAPVKDVPDVYITKSSSTNFNGGSRKSAGKEINDENNTERFRLSMPDMTEITLGFINKPFPGIQNSLNPTPQADVKPALQNYEDDPKTCPIDQVPSKNMVSTPFHPSVNVFSLPDMSNISLINGTPCVTTENTIMLERPAESTNRTAAMSPIKERSNEGTHSSLENRTAEPSHHTNSHSSQVSSKQNLITDPFCKTHQKKVFDNLAIPLEHYDTYHYLNEDLPLLRTNLQVVIGFWRGVVEKQVAKGGNGHIYKLSTDCTLAIDSGMVDVALKVMKFTNFWEFYICHEIHERLKKFPNTVDMSSCYPVIKDAYFYNNGSILITPFYKYGTLLDFVNKKQAELCNSSTCEALAVYFLIELLTIVDHLHKCKIIHGDIKPDNIIIKLKKMISPDLKVPKLLTLIDFGEALDMSTYPEGTRFHGKVMTSGFQCIEMRTEKPWSYQTDLFGIVGTIHTVLFGKYMNVCHFQGKWQLTSNFQRKWNIPLWRQFFHDLLNIPSTDQLPNLIGIRDQFIEYFKSSLMVPFKMAMYSDMPHN